MWDSLVQAAALCFLVQLIAVLAIRWWRKPRSVTVKKKRAEDQSPQERAAEALGLKLNGSQTTMVGERGSCVVEVSWSSEGTSFSVRQDRVDVSLRADGELGFDFLIGDDRFDTKINARGNEVACRAVLDANARAGALNAFSMLRKLRVEDGVALWRFDGPLYAVESLETALDRMIPAVSGFVLASADVERIAGHVATDPCPGVRLRCLELLVRKFPNRTETAGAIRAGFSDTDREVQLVAASRLGEEGWAVILESTDAGQPEPVRERAIREVGRQFPSERAVPILRRAIRDPLVRIRIAAIETLAEHHPEDLVKVAIRRSAPLEVQEALLAAASKVGAKAEPVLLALAERGDDAIRLQAIVALASVGTVAAIPRLREIGVGALRNAIETTVAEIQARLEGAEPGQLMLAEPKLSGALALTAGEGALSMPKQRKQPA